MTELVPLKCNHPASAADQTVVLFSAGDLFAGLRVAVLGGFVVGG